MGLPNFLFVLLAVLRSLCVSFSASHSKLAPELTMHSFLLLSSLWSMVSRGIKFRHFHTFVVTVEQAWKASIYIFIGVYDDSALFKLHELNCRFRGIWNMSLLFILSRPMRKSDSNHLRTMALRFYLICCCCALLEFCLSWFHRLPTSHLYLWG